MKPRAFLVGVLALGCAVPPLAAQKPGRNKPPKGDGDPAADASESRLAKREEKAVTKSARNGSAPNEAGTESKSLEKLRERLGVSDDAEWAVISERLKRVEELRRANGSAAGPRALVATGDKPRRTARGSADELSALRAAVRDQYPDAEIKARLERAHRAYLQREDEMRKAEGELRAVLSVRQEAMVVMLGLLPP